MRCRTVVLADTIPITQRDEPELPQYSAHAEVSSSKRAPVCASKGIKDLSPYKCIILKQEAQQRTISVQCTVHDKEKMNVK